MSEFTESHPKLPELKRPLWIIGASDYNLGMTLRKVAEQLGDYAEIITTDEQSCDVTDSQILNRHAERIHNRWGGHGLDVAYCAGINILDPIERVSEMDMWQTFNVNVMGFIRTMSALASEYRNNVSVVAVASDAARNPMRNSINYCASKAALVQAVRVAARELAPRFRVNAVSPAIIDGTPMTTTIDAEVQQQRRWSLEEAQAYERSMIPMGRRAEKQEVAELILKVLEGPDFMTGSNVEITGGK